MDWQSCWVPGVLSPIFCLRPSHSVLRHGARGALLAAMATIAQEAASEAAAADIFTLQCHIDLACLLLPLAAADVFTPQCHLDLACL